MYYRIARLRDTPQTDKTYRKNMQTSTTNRAQNEGARRNAKQRQGSQAGSYGVLLQPNTNCTHAEEVGFDTDGNTHDKKTEQQNDSPRAVAHTINSTHDPGDRPTRQAIPRTVCHLKEGGEAVETGCDFRVAMAVRFLVDRQRLSEQRLRFVEISCDTTISADTHRGGRGKEGCL